MDEEMVIALARRAGLDKALAEHPRDVLDIALGDEISELTGTGQAQKTPPSVD